MPKINPIQENTNLIKKARSASYWLFGSNIAIQLISWAITVFVARILSPDDYGLFGMAALITSSLVVFNELGLGPAIIQKKDLTKEQLSSCFWIIMAINLFLYFIAFISAPLVASFFREERLIAIIRVAAISVVIGGLYKIPYSLLTKELMFKKVYCRFCIKTLWRRIHSFACYFWLWGLEPCLWPDCMGSCKINFVIYFCRLAS